MEYIPGILAIALIHFLALIVSHRAVRGRVRSFQHYAEKVMGVLLIALGIRLALSSSK